MPDRADLGPLGPSEWRLGDLGRALVGVLGSAIGLLIAGIVLPGLRLPGWPAAVALSLSIALTSALFRPVLVGVASRFGWPGAVLLGLFGQAVMVGLNLRFFDWMVSFSPLSVIVASWIVSLVSTTVVWLVTAGTDDAVTASLIRKGHRGRRPVVADPDVPGVVFVQADGVPYPLLELGVMSGNFATLSRWVRSGSHRMAEWQPKLPATTPASQMGILHGTIEGIPAFRWLDRETGRIYVANRATDAADIEAMHSDGHGLLADDGVSIGNLFTGDAVNAYATMSAINRTQETIETRTAVSRFLARPDGFARGLSRTLSEIIRERFQSKRAIRRDLQPRVVRSWFFALERAGLNGVLRDLNTSLVAESMLAGRRSIYVNYVDYDAVAHHAGPLRPEALSALAGIDATIGQLERVAAYCPRPYRFVVVSDHGQSQGAVFADRYGEDLATLVGRLAQVEVATIVENPEATGRLNAIFAGGASADTVFGRALGRVSDRLTDGEAVETVVPAPPGSPGSMATAVTGAPGPTGTTAPTQEFIVFGSGNLGLVFVADQPRRLTLEELTERYPVLLPGLVVHPGVSFVVVDSREHGPVAIGRDGEHHVMTGVVVGTDPLEAFGSHAADFVRRAALMPEAPDIYVNSLVDDMGEVAAFEGLVGCHGGLGGWQDKAIVVWPADLPEPERKIVGADALHDVLVGWLEHLGHRADLAPSHTRSYDVHRVERFGPDGADTASTRG